LEEIPMSSEQEFQQKYLAEFKNPLVEHLARSLSQQAGYIREYSDFTKLPDDAVHSFREMAAEYASILEVDPYTYTSYKEGYTEGYEQGYHEGYMEGYEQGYYEGYAGNYDWRQE
jgi:flagellar biosynthesis/type III secretory pathway protein FliH